MGAMAGKVAAGVGLAVVMAGGHAKGAAEDNAAPAHPVVSHVTKAIAHKSASRPSALPVVDNAPPVTFTTNSGKVDQAVRYLAEGPGYHLYLTDQEAVLALHTPKGSGPVRIGVLHLSPVGAAPGRAVTSPTGRRSAVTSQVWPGIDWAWHGTTKGASYDLTLAKGVDAKAARFELLDARSVKLDPNGNLLITTARGVLMLPAPTAWQTDTKGARRAVPVQYVLVGGTAFGYRLGSHDATRPVTVETTTSH